MANIYLSFIMLATVPSILCTLTYLILVTTHEQVLFFSYFTHENLEVQKG